jgi:hypothetical protein
VFVRLHDDDFVDDELLLGLLLQVHLLNCHLYRMFYVKVVQRINKC